MKPNVCRVHPCATVLPAGRTLCHFHRPRWMDPERLARAMKVAYDMRP